jgi:hypothetical protein
MLRHSSRRCLDIIVFFLKKNITQDIKYNDDKILFL